MYNSIDFTKIGGLWLTQNTFEYMQAGISNVLDAIAQLVGHRAVLNGVQVVGGNVTNGWISYNGMILPFVGGTKTDHIDIETIITDEQFDDGNLKPTYTTKRLIMVSVATGTSFPFAQLIYASKIKDIHLPGDIKELACDADYITANFDNTGLGINLRQGWAICNGNNGTINKKGRVSVMLDTDQTEFDTIGKPGGAKTHSLTEPQLPVITPQIRGGQNGSASGGSWDNAPIDWSETGNPHGYIVNGKPFGGNQPHNNLQPYIVTLFIQKL
ncbi:MAG: hypothetical protein LC096_06695 [Bacteroidia bacterium]|nr:hypothetical protein [Bacteroidia bacterium]